MQTLAPMRVLVAAATLALVASACGQKPGVHVEQGGLALPAVGQDGTTPTTDATGAPVDPGAQPVGGDQSDPTASSGSSGAGASTGGASSVPATGGDRGTTGGTAGGGTTPTAGSTAAPGGSSSGSGSGGAGGSGGGDAGPAPSQGEATPPAGQAGGPRQVTGSDRTGVTADTITVGVHAPATGAAPLPTTSFEKSRDLYWRDLFERRGGDVLGRTRVVVEYRDDKYSPDSAVQVCRELRATSFLLAGGGGTDQIQACGRLAQIEQFPYFSAGVTEDGLRGNPWYFAASMSYAQQGPLLASYVASNPDGVPALGPDAKIGTIITDTPNFKDARDGWLRGLEQAGLENLALYEHPKGDISWYPEAAKRMKDAGVDVIYVLSAPVDYIQLANVANERFDYNPQFIGVGLSKGLNAVLQSGCGDPGTTIDDGIFLSPFPGLDWARQNTPEFFQAGQRFGAPTDDIALALWAQAKALHALFEGYGEVFGDDLTREDFRAFVEQVPPQDTGIFPTTGYSPDNHFGARNAHVLQADCGKREYVTLHTFADGF